MRKFTSDQTPFLVNQDMGLHRPYHLAIGMMVISEYALVEAYTSLLLNALAKGDPEAAGAIYGEIRQGQVQGKALRAVAKAVLSPEDAGLLNDILKIAKKASDIRDALAHRLWMYDKTLPLDVVLVDPALVWKSDLATKKLGGPGPVPIEGARQLQQMMRDAGQLWSRGELEEARKICVRSSTGLLAFRLMHTSAAGSAEHAQHRKTLLTVIEQQKTADKPKPPPADP